MGSVLARVDHLVYAVHDLAQGVSALEELTHVRATPGGSHPGLGTHNALLALGPRCYLELIAPDPAQPKPAQPRWLGVDDDALPKLTTWAMTTADLPGEVARAQQAGIPIGEVRTGRRALADGTELSWRLSFAPMLIAGGLVPFFIDWAASAHPALTAPRGAELLSLHGEHPDPSAVRAMLRELDVDLPVRVGPAPALVALLGTPAGEVELR